jgi:hypothetical protein
MLYFFALCLTITIDISSRSRCLSDQDLLGIVAMVIDWKIAKAEMMCKRGKGRESRFEMSRIMSQRQLRKDAVSQTLISRSTARLCQWGA